MHLCHLKKDGLYTFDESHVSGQFLLDKSKDEPDLDDPSGRQIFPQIRSHSPFAMNVFRFCLHIHGRLRFGPDDLSVRQTCLQRDIRSVNLTKFSSYCGIF